MQLAAMPPLMRRCRSVKQACFQPRSPVNFGGFYSPLRAYLFGLIGGAADMGVRSVSIWAMALCAFARVVLQAPV